MDLLGNLKRHSEEIEEEKEQFKFYAQMLYCNQKLLWYQVVPFALSITEITHLMHSICKHSKFFSFFFFAGNR